MQVRPDVLAIVPARKGSKGLPGKNLRKLDGRHLVEWSIKQALDSATVSLVHVSTDCSVTADLAKSMGADAPYLRPSSLATDEATTFSVVEFALEHYASKSRTFDYVVLVEPTSPLRKKDDLDRAVTLLVESQAEFDSLVTVGRVRDHPSIVKRIHDSRVVPWDTNLKQPTRRQDLEAAWFPFGVAYVAKTDVLLEEQTFYTKRCMGMPLERFQEYEIDDEFDFLCVETILRAIGGHR